MAMVSEFLQGIEPGLQHHLYLGAIATADRVLHLLSRQWPWVYVFDIESLAAVKLQRFAPNPDRELQWQHAHADQIRAVNTFETLRDDGALSV